MKVDESKIVDLLSFEEISSSGEACSFIDLENGWGLKCYDCREARNTSFTCQKYLANKGLAPKVGKKFELTDHDGYSWYCFVTEIAETLVGYGICNEHAWDEESDEYELDEDDFRHMYCREERDDWISEVYDLTGYYYTDDHAGNWGWIIRDNENKLVCIDFDTCIFLEKRILNGEIK